MAVSEYEVENLFIERLGTIGYQFIQLRDYAEVKKNFKDQLQKFNKAAIIESKVAERRFRFCTLNTM